MQPTKFLVIKFRFRDFTFKLPQGDYVCLGCPAFLLVSVSFFVGKVLTVVGGVGQRAGGFTAWICGGWIFERRGCMWQFLLLRERRWPAPWD